ncbi:MAG TPA: hypothetical protein VLF87_00565 [Patescibacteria group bacterium]|nr:hypothetical protein [Candidatus Saccharimonadales bacterium]HSX46472.1 hypothetical protein [Patescibacteria group bacterium]
MALAKDLETRIRGSLRDIDVSEVPKEQHEHITKLRQLVTDSKLDARDYEYAETREEQVRHAKAVKPRLEEIRQHMLRLSEYNMFTAIEIAELGALIEQMIDKLR